jgi:uncharacterized protein (UPF0332 family)
MFYCTTALLRTENIITKSHSGTLSKFSEVFIKTNRIPIKYSTMLRRAFDYRQSCDYDIEVMITDAEAQILVDYATEFHELTKSILEKLASQHSQL